MAVRTDPTKTSEPLDGEFLVLLPKQKVAWSFWRDDFPNLAELIARAVGGAAAAWLVYRLTS